MYVLISSKLDNDNTGTNNTRHKGYHNLTSDVQ